MVASAAPVVPSAGQPDSRNQDQVEDAVEQRADELRDHNGRPCCRSPARRPFRDKQRENAARTQ